MPSTSQFLLSARFWCVLQAKIPTLVRSCTHTLIKLISRRGVSFPLSLCYGEPSVQVRLWEKIINSGVREHRKKTKRRADKEAKVSFSSWYNTACANSTARREDSVLCVSHFRAGDTITLTSLNASSRGMFSTQTPNAESARIKQYLQVTREYSARILRQIYAAPWPQAFSAAGRSTPCLSALQRLAPGFAMQTTSCACRILILALRVVCGLRNSFWSRGWELTTLKGYITLEVARSHKHTTLKDKYIKAKFILFLIIYFWFVDNALTKILLSILLIGFSRKRISLKLSIWFHCQKALNKYMKHF